MRPAQLADLFDPLDRDILERVGRVERKGDQDDVRFRVAERSEALRAELGGERAGSLTPAVEPEFPTRGPFRDPGLTSYSSWPL